LKAVDSTTDLADEVAAKQEDAKELDREEIEEKGTILKVNADPY